MDAVLWRYSGRIARIEKQHYKDVKQKKLNTCNISFSYCVESCPILNGAVPTGMLFNVLVAMLYESPDTGLGYTILLAF